MGRTGKQRSEHLSIQEPMIHQEIESCRCRVTQQVQVVDWPKPGIKHLTQAKNLLKNKRISIM